GVRAAVCGLPGTDLSLRPPHVRRRGGRRCGAGDLPGAAARRAIRRGSRLAVMRLEEAGDADRIVEATAPDEPSPFDDLSRTEAVAAVRAAIQSLPPVYREIITLCELEELDYAAAA